MRDSEKVAEALTDPNTGTYYDERIGRYRMFVPVPGEGVNNVEDEKDARYREIGSVSELIKATNLKHFKKAKEYIWETWMRGD